MNFVALIAALALGWLVRRFVARRMERVALDRLPVDVDGVVEGGGGFTHAGSRDRAVLILHGFGDTPQTLRYLGDHLHGLGFTVHAPLLPGHGRTLAEFGGSAADAWLEAAAHEFDAMRDRFGFVGLVGVSMGGALAVILASRAATVTAAASRQVGQEAAVRAAGRDGPDALVLLAPYLSMRARARRLATLHRVVSPFAVYLPSREEGSIRDPSERALNRGFGIVTPRLLRELQRVVAWAEAALPRVAQPTLVIQSRDDNRIEVAAAERAFASLGAREKRLVWIEGSGHVITVDTGREHVLTMTGTWLLERVEGNTPRSRDGDDEG